MKRVKAHHQSPSPRKDKPNLFVKDDLEVIDRMRTQSIELERQKVMLRIDSRTHVLVSPELATPEYAKILRARYKISYDPPAKGGRRKK